MYDVRKIRADFPILSRQVNGKPLVYLDNGASAQKPQVVIDAMTQAYSHEYANVHRGLHYPVEPCDRKVRGHPCASWPAS
jgi:cysteine desulfurase/selenocysteine lyase